MAAGPFTERTALPAYLARSSSRAGYALAHLTETTA